MQTNYNNDQQNATHGSTQNITPQAYKKFSDLHDGSSEHVAFIVQSISSRKDTRGNDFCDIDAADGATSVNLKLWNTSADKARIKQGDVIIARVNCKEYHGSLSYSFRNYKVDTTMDASSFVKKAPMTQSDMLVTINKLVSEMDQCSKSSRLVRYLILDNSENRKMFLHHPGGRSMHHAYIGGLAYHSISMALQARQAAKLYGFNRDLAVAGCLLHDIGKLQEITCDEMGAAEYTISGQIEGHLVLGTRMLDAACSQLGIDANDSEVFQLRHIIESHHGEPEHGALHKPMTGEALLVSFLDKMDASIDAYRSSIENEADGTMTAKPVRMLERRMYKPGK